MEDSTYFELEYNTYLKCKFVFRDGVGFIEFSHAQFNYLQLHVDTDIVKDLTLYNTLVKDKVQFEVYINNTKCRTLLRALQLYEEVVITCG